MKSELRSLLEVRLGSRVTEVRPLSGGDINEAYSVALADGRQLFVKTNSSAPSTLFGSEALGLGWLRAAQAIRVPEVIAVSTPSDRTQFLVLELLVSAAPVSEFDELLGQRLAALHRVGAPAFGLDHENFIGSLPQSNARCASWAEFFQSQRLEPQLRRAVDAGKLSYAGRRNFERLFAKLPELLGAAEAPARLHGDLWSGNLHVDAEGEPVLIDPAVYGGHREMDLAMMRLFGGFSERVFQVYAAAFPLAAGAAERIPLFQIYPLLVHVNLFGGSYAGSVERALLRYV